MALYRQLGVAFELETLAHACAGLTMLWFASAPDRPLGSRGRGRRPRRRSPGAGVSRSPTAPRRARCGERILDIRLARIRRRPHT